MQKKQEFPDDSREKRLFGGNRPKQNAEKAHTSCVQNCAVRESIREIYDVVMRYPILICRMDPSPHSPGKPGAEAPRLKDFLFHNHLPKTRQLRFILHAFGTRPVRIRAPRPIGP